MENKGDSEMTTICQLNDDCLLNVFMKLPLKARVRMGAVCKQWLNVGRRSWSDVKEMVLYSNKKNKFSGDLNNLRLSIEWDDDAVEKFLNYCGRYLTMLKLTVQYSMTESTKMKIISGVAKHCSNLETLQISLKCYPGIELDEIFLRCAKLEVITILMNDDVRFYKQCLLNMTKLKIKQLSLYGQLNCEEDGSRDIFPQEDLEFHHLKTLLLSDFILEPQKSTIDKYCTLTALTLSDCIVDGPIDTCMGNLPNLEYLTFNDTSYKTTTTDELLDSISTNCIKLKCVKLIGCSMVSDDGLCAIAEIPTIEELHLESLKICGYSFTMFETLKKFRCINCYYVEQDNIISLLENAYNLDELILINSGATSKILRLAKEMSRQRRNNIPLNIIVQPEVSSDECSE